MNQKKNKTILIIAILFIVLAIGTVVAYAFVATDIFRSNKDTFFKYAIGIFDDKKGFINSDVIQYFEKQKNTPFETNGNLSFNISSSNNEDDFEHINNCEISFSGKVNKKDLKSVQNIDINYANDVKFPFTYKKNGNTVGFQTDYIGSKYIAVELDKLNNLKNAADINIDVPIISKTIDEVNVSNEQAQYIKDTYLNILNKELKDSNFLNIKEEGMNGYKLSLSGEEFKNVTIKLLETLKNDQITLNILNEYISIQNTISKITTNDIEEMINSLNSNENLNNERIELTLYIKNKQAQKIIIVTNEIRISIEKIETGNEKQYNISLDILNDNENVSVNFVAKYSGLQSLQLITENYQLEIETDDNKYIYYLNNDVDFIEDFDFNDFTSSNSIILTKLDNMQSSTLVNAIIERLDAVNTDQMEKLGLTEDKNPLKYAIPSFEFYSTSNNIINRSNEEMDELEITTFNQKFELYQSTNLRGTTVKGLLSTILNNNQAHENSNEQITEINFDGQEYTPSEENITLIKSEVKTEEYYKVEFEKDEETGKIYRAVINKK